MVKKIELDLKALDGLDEPVVKQAKRLLGRARRLADDAAHSAKSALRERHLRIGVTGLSQAGKTIFMASLIKNLEAYARGADTLPTFTRNGKSGAIQRIEIKPIPSEDIPYFPHDDIYRRLADGREAWPERTTDVAGVNMVLHPKSSLSGRLNVEIFDYPGEWLVDRTMLTPGLTYVEWSKTILERLSPFSELPEWVEFDGYLQSLDWSSSAGVEEAAREAHRRYKALMIACRDQVGLRFLQPGRFLCPGPRGELPMHWFAPTLVTEEPERPGADSLYRTMERRFDAYVRNAREFFDRYFGRIDRQIVLVDVLAALSEGRVVYEDTRAAVNEIAATFEPQSWLGRMMSWKSVPKATFVATKADYLHQDEIGNMVVQLGVMVAGGLDNLLERRFTEKPRAIAALWCSRDDSLDGRPGVAFRNVRTGGQTLFRFGQIPGEVPSDDFWTRDGGIFTMPRMEPPRLDPDGDAGMPHRGLDAVLFDVLGDQI